MYKAGTIREASYLGERRIEIDIVKEGFPVDKEIGTIKFQVKEAEKDVLLGFATAVKRYLNKKNEVFK